MGLYNVLIDTGAPPMALPCALRRAGVSEPASSLLDAVRRVVLPSKDSVARSMFKRTMRARRLARLSAVYRLEMRVDFVAVFSSDIRGARKWFPEPSDDWTFPAPCGCPEAPKYGCALCK